LNRIAFWAYIGVILLFATVTIGAFTRAYGAGMGCGPDWPTCNGEIVPISTFGFATALEYFHRVFAGLGFLAVLYASYLALKAGGRVKGWAIATLVVLAAQVLLGALVVWYHLSPPLSAMHTTLAIVTVALATGMAVEAARVGQKP
jgi:heme A synthase